LVGPIRRDRQVTRCRETWSPNTARNRVETHALRQREALQCRKAQSEAQPEGVPYG